MNRFEQIDWIAPPNVDSSIDELNWITQNKCEKWKVMGGDCESLIVEIDGFFFFNKKWIFKIEWNPKWSAA